MLYERGRQAWRGTAVRVIFALWAGTLLAASSVQAQPSGQTPGRLQGVGVEERLGELLPRDIPFRDADGRAVVLGDYLDGERPVLLNLVYHNCPMLCNLVLDGLYQTLRGMEWVPGSEFDVVTVSFAADETPAMARRQKDKYIEALGKPAAAAGWHFLTGSQAAIDRLTGAIGFEYRWDDYQQQYAHPAMLLFVSGEGMISRYLYGLEYAPRDVRTALVEASNGKVGSALDRVILYCFQYDADANSYVPVALNMMKLGGMLTLLVLGLVLFIFWRRERLRLDGAAASLAS